MERVHSDVQDNTAGRLGLAGQRCAACGTTVYPAQECCSACGDMDRLEPAALSSRGSIYAFSEVRVPRPDRPDPYVLAFVDFPEGPRVLGRVEGEASALEVGDVVETVFARADDIETANGDFTFRKVEQ